MDQWNRTQSPEINPRLYSQLIFVKGSRGIKLSKNSLFHKWFWDSWTGTCKKNETWPPTYTIHKINSRWIKDLNISCDTIKVLEENIGSKISNIPLSSIFTIISSRAREIKERINKWNYIKLKSFWWLETTSSKWKGSQPYGKIYLPMIPQTRVWSPKYIRKLYDSTLGRQTIQLKNG